MRSQKINLNTNSMQPGWLAQDMIQQNRSQNHLVGLRILNDKPDNKEKKTVAVIVTFCSGGSYDRLFSTI